MSRPIIFKWVWVAEGSRYLRNERLYSVGIRDDGTLHNPNGYPEDEVRPAVEAAIGRRRKRASEAAKRAAVTRAARKERLVYQVVGRLKAGGQLIPGTNCEICGKALGDPDSKARGIGSDCWQFILSMIDGRPAG